MAVKPYTCARQGGKCSESVERSVEPGAPDRQWRVRVRFDLRAGCSSLLDLEYYRELFIFMYLVIALIF